MASSTHPIKEAAPGNRLLFWSMAYKMSDAIMLLEKEGVLDLICDTPMAVSDIAARTNLAGQTLESLLGLLVKAGILKKKANIYQLPGQENTVLPMVRLEAQARRWHWDKESLKKSLLGAGGSDPMKYASDESRKSYFLAMRAAVKNVSLHLLRFAHLRNEPEIVDLGGADGAMGLFLLPYLNNAHYTVVDKETSRENFIRLRETSNLENRITFTGEDLSNPRVLNGLLENADAVIMSNILHMFTGKVRGNLLSYIFAAIKPGCRIIVYDQFIGDEAEVEVADLMTVDWLNCGADFSVTACHFIETLGTIGYKNGKFKKFASLPGTFVGAER